MKRALGIATLFALVLAVIWTAWRTSSHREDALVTSPGNSELQIPNSSLPPSLPAEQLNLATDLNAPSHDIRRDLQILSELLATFRANFPGDGNPVGNNAEITAALIGDNRLRIAFVSAPHPALNASRELCDRWGTPFFFHADSGTRMEIRSAGPDRVHFTADDAVLSP